LCWNAVIAIFTPDNSTVESGIAHVLFATWDRWAPVAALGQLLPIGATVARILGRNRAMLVLSRKVGEKIWIGENISVTVVRVTQGIVRIGIEAPEELPIVREEIRDQLAESSEPLGAAKRRRGETGRPHEIA
jgi:carbon storage regulator